MTRLFAFALHNPRRTILAGVVVTLAMGSGLTRLELRTDGQALVPQDAPEVRYDREVRETFDVEDQLAVVVETDDPAGVFNLRTLRLVDELTHELSAVDGVDPREVTSLATERIRWSGGRARDYTSVLDPLPETAADLEAIRADLAELPIYEGTLLSLDGHGQGTEWSPSATAILIGLPAGAERASIYRQVREVVAARGELAEKIHVVGAPVAESLLGTHILEDLTLLVPIAVLVMSLVFFLRYRSFVAVLLPMTEVGACLVFVFGLMGHAGVPVSLVITVMPVILTAVGVADEIHVFDRYVHVLSRGKEGGSPLLQTMNEMWWPVVKTSLTTGIAFLSFLLSPIAPVRHFGAMTAIGILFCMVWSLSVIPAGLALTRKGFAVAAAGAWPRRFVSADEWIRRRRGVVVAAMVLVALAVPFGLKRLVVQDSWIDGFAPTSPFRQSTEKVNRLFHGTHVLLVHFDTRPLEIRGELEPLSPSSVQIPEGLVLLVPFAKGLEPVSLVGEQVLVGAVPAKGVGRGRRPELYARVSGARREGDRLRVEMTLELDDRKKAFLTSRPDRRWTFFAAGRRLLDPGLLALARETGDFIEGRLDDVGGGVLDPHGQVAVARSIVWGGRGGDGEIGETPLRNRFFLSAFGNVRGAERLEEVFDEDRRQGLITVFLKNPSFVDVGRLMDEIRGYASRQLAPRGVRVGFAGDVAVSQTMIDAIVTTQTRSLILSLVGIFLVTAILGRSPWLGVLCLLPPALAVLINFAVMGAAGIPLGVATSMFSAMTIGIGVDFAIHLTERFRFLAATCRDPGRRLRETLAVTGPAIATNALVVAAGFAVMTLSQVPANGRLGLFVVTSVLTCFLATLVLLPFLITVREPREEAA